MAALGPVDLELRWRDRLALTGPRHGACEDAELFVPADDPTSRSPVHRLAVISPNALDGPPPLHLSSRSRVAAERAFTVDLGRAISESTASA